MTRVADVVSGRVRLKPDTTYDGLRTQGHAEGFREMNRATAGEL
jgi:hypothetical protein